MLVSLFPGTPPYIKLSTHVPQLVPVTNRFFIHARRKCSNSQRIDQIGLSKLEISRLWLSGDFPIVQQWMRPILCDSPLAILVPTVKARLPPSHLLIGSVNFLVELIVDILSAFHRLFAFFNQQFDAPHDISYFAFRKEDDAACTAPIQTLW